MTTSKTVAFVEPSFYGVSFVKAAFEQGHRVISIVSSPNNPQKYGYEGIYHDLIVADIRDEESLYQAIVQSPYADQLDALIPATDYASHLTAKVAERLGLKGVPFEAALKSRNKDLAREAYAEHRVPSAAFRKVRTFEEAAAAAADIGYPIVLKPTNCASSQHVYFISSVNELQAAMDVIVEFKVSYMDFKVREEYLVEQYLEGPEFSVELFVSEGVPLFSVVTEKTTSPLPYFVEVLHTLPTSVHTDREDEIVHTAVKALRAIGITNGPSHVEVKLTSDGARIIEVNGRPGGDNISSDLLVQALGVDIFEATVNFYLDNPIAIQRKHERAAAIAYVTAEREGIFANLKGLESWSQHPSVVRYQISVSPGEIISPAKSSDDRLGYVITVGDTPQEAKELALSLVNSLQIVYQQQDAGIAKV
ncbi:ATP-grasp domain-containing protein [Paenibacillus sp. ACRRX]|uniref:ATP-grasp domain-containing protein n=1 Tax=unclassified Paenibacillus TaxID=185978 RepID=UPI001EF49E04|nr:MULTISPECIES: ATP-grasp domain-containing protein [unclassified Paenibacillus]MCG7409276.1 ATP-grasp domain-containing protein [Paenibacillus sp. ACRRX]MDK8179931.1 ATP-grasp domain-containing protein [Paenibacillus sp. UMB4589-SE434]